MGQANSRGSASERPRHRARPASVAGIVESSSEGVRAGESQPPATSAQAEPPPRSPPSLSSRFFSPLSSVASLVADAGSSASTPSSDRLHRLSRTARARHSLSSIPHFFHRHSPIGSRLPFSASQPRPSTTPDPRLQDRPSRTRAALPDLRLSFENASPTPLTTARRESRAGSLRPERGLRSINPLRRRRSREDDEVAVLSRLLSTAARATAASLMESENEMDMTDMDGDSIRGRSRDDDDNTFHSFLQALQNGTIASALRHSGATVGPNADLSVVPSRPFNFFRMFRFNYVRDGAGLSVTPNDPNNPNNPGATDGNDSGSEVSRMVPVIIVGIRSIQPGRPGNGSNANPFLDVLAGIPTPETLHDVPTAEEWHEQQQQQQQQQQQRQRQGGRRANRRRASMGGANTRATNHEGENRERPTERLLRPWSTVVDSPSGPLPPPTTPASSGLSPGSSGVTTPASPVVSPRGSGQPSGDEVDPEPRAYRPRSPRRRRVSESDFGRFGSGSSRRNGVVEPDNAGGSRSWIIYVLGGSYPEDHPLLTAPSLFTESPTYEDLLLLSSIIGPAKPPVASNEEVAAAPGLYRVRNVSGCLMAQVVTPSGDGSLDMMILPEQTCQVCLCNYDEGDEARRLVECGHWFHRICIEQWLTTGRNSCPLCRGRGVAEQQTDLPQPETVFDPTRHTELT